MFTYKTINSNKDYYNKKIFVGFILCIHAGDLQLL